MQVMQISRNVEGVWSVAGFTEAPWFWQSLARRMFSLRIQVLSSFQVRHLFFFCPAGSFDGYRTCGRCWAVTASMWLAFRWPWCDWQCWGRASPLMTALPNAVCAAFGGMALLAVDMNEPLLLRFAVTPRDAFSPTASLPKSLGKEIFPWVCRQVLSSASSEIAFGAW